MTTFTIETETNNITAHATKQEAKALPNAERFSSAEELATLAADWPTARLIEIWNSIPGVTPVKKFTDRNAATTRVWKAIQTLGDSIPAVEPACDTAQAEPEIGADQEQPASGSDDVQPEPAANQAEANVGAQSPDVAAAEENATKKATRQEKVPTGEPKPNATREGSKTTTILTLMKRESGVTLKEIMEATGWQAHSVRGFISGTLGKKMGLVIGSAKAENGERTYTIAS